LEENGGLLVWMVMGGGGGSCVMDAFQDDVNFFNPKNVIYA